MAKTKTSYFCNNCGYESAKWLGRCPTCDQWNTFVEEVIQSGAKTQRLWEEKGNGSTSAKAVKLNEIEKESTPRIPSGDAELDRVLGGGIVPGSLVLIGGEPGIGKSTLMLQLSMASSDYPVLYVSGEESPSQVKLRADRLGLNTESCFFLAETKTSNIFQQIKKVNPRIVIVDSIQTSQSTLVDSTPGSVTQVRQCAGEYMQFAKETNTSVFLIGHITKDGSIAGPKVLEHMVDTVLQFEGDLHMAYRILRTTKNRFGSTSELGIYEMSNKGLTIVPNPSEVLLSNSNEEATGVAIGATQEGNRAILIEVQALVTPATYGTPQRSSTGFDSRRLNMLLAVIEKRAGLKLGLHDVFLNMAGGIKVEDPAIDLAICMAIVSSLEDIVIDRKIAFAAEVGLSGEIRPVPRIESRISEAEKLGFSEIYIAKQGKKSISSNGEIEVKSFSKLTAVISDLFG